MYFQLYPSTHHTEGIESGLLPTPTTMTGGTTSDNFTDNLHDLAKKKLLPTPTAMDSTNATATMKSTQVKEGSMHSVTLTRAMAMGMLPTPTKSDFQPRWKTENWEGNSDLPSVINEMLGTHSQLSPQFVLEMMGFPTDWTLLPFLSGETSQSKQEEMP
jgi:hypothetical protein